MSKSKNIELTETAAKEIKSIIEDNEELKNADKVYLRVGVKGGGCSGFSYTMDITENKSERDEEFEVKGVNVITDPKSLLYLEGTVISFKDTVMERGFSFNNPNASGTCGCGQSFSA